MEKRGLSGVVTAMILIALTISLIAIVWAVVTNLVQDRLDSVEGCTDSFGKVELSREFTCYDSDNDILQFAISIKDIEVDNVVVAVVSEGSGSGFIINSTGTYENETLVTKYSGTGDPVLPGRNSISTYNYSLSTDPDTLRISPTISGNDCGESDSVSSFPSCSSLL